MKVNVKLDESTNAGQKVSSARVETPLKRHENFKYKDIEHRFKVFEDIIIERVRSLQNQVQVAKNQIKKVEEKKMEPQNIEKEVFDDLKSQ